MKTPELLIEREADLKCPPLHCRNYNQDTDEEEDEEESEEEDSEEDEDDEEENDYKAMGHSCECLRGRN